MWIGFLHTGWKNERMKEWNFEMKVSPFRGRLASRRQSYDSMIWNLIFQIVLSPKTPPPPTLFQCFVLCFVLGLFSFSFFLKMLSMLVFMFCKIDFYFFCGYCSSCLLTVRKVNMTRLCFSLQNFVSSQRGTIILCSGYGLSLNYQSSVKCLNNWPYFQVLSPWQLPLM